MNSLSDNEVIEKIGRSSLRTKENPAELHVISYGLSYYLLLMVIKRYKRKRFQ